MSLILCLLLFFFSQLSSGEKNDGSPKTDVEIFYEVGKSLVPMTDKITHRYSEMYGTFFLPYLHRQHNVLKRGIKFLEIGLGCNMGYKGGAIASTQLWKSFLTEQDEHWEAEYDAECVKMLQDRGKLKDVRVVTGDQGNATVLQSWIQQTGGQFDIIIDDGGHRNDHIYASFMNLWPQLKPGGLYFIEDLQVSRHPEFADATGHKNIMLDYIHSWVEQLVIMNWYDRPEWNEKKELIRGKPLPAGISFITCFMKACVIAKCDGKKGSLCSKKGSKQRPDLD